MPSPQPVPVDDITDIGAVCLFWFRSSASTANQTVGVFFNLVTKTTRDVSALPVGGAERKIVMEARRRGLAITWRQEEHGRMGGV